MWEWSSTAAPEIDRDDEAPVVDSSIVIDGAASPAIGHFLGTRGDARGHYTVGLRRRTMRVDWHTAGIAGNTGGGRESVGPPRDAVLLGLVVVCSAAAGPSSRTSCASSWALWALRRRARRAEEGSSILLCGYFVECIGQTDGRGAPATVLMLGECDGAAVGARVTS